jgi:hypothetical protein
VIRVNKSTFRFGSAPKLGQLKAASADRRFKFQKSRQLFICAHNETLPVAVRVSNPDGPTVRING